MKHGAVSSRCQSARCRFVIGWPLSMEDTAVLFCEDSENDRLVYVDRQIDERADHFEPCPDCRAGLDLTGPPGPYWHRGALCGECYTALESLGDIADAKDERIRIMDPVQQRWIMERPDVTPRLDELSTPEAVRPEDPAPTMLPFFPRIP